MIRTTLDTFWKRFFKNKCSILQTLHTSCFFTFLVLIPRYLHPYRELGLHVNEFVVGNNCHVVEPQVAACFLKTTGASK